jgi:hypothetical protein
LGHAYRWERIEILLYNIIYEIIFHK